MTAQPNIAEALHGELIALKAANEAHATKLDEQYRNLRTHFDGKLADSAEVRALVDEKTKEYALLSAQAQNFRSEIDVMKRQLDAPVFAGGKDADDSDKRSGIELQRRAHIHKVGSVEGFKADMSNLVNVGHLRSAVTKYMQVGLITKEQAYKSLDADEKRAFDAASMSTGFFSPEILGYVQDPNYLPASMLDLYGVLNVSKSRFLFLKVIDYGAIGQYNCDAVCDAQLGPAGNMVWLEGKTYDFRGVFCLQKKVLQEANIDILGFMMYSAQRSYFINRNRATVVGDGVNEPQGWLTAQNGFAVSKTNVAGNFNHVDFRRWASTFPVELGKPMVVMHQNMLGYLAAQVSSIGEFIFGEEKMMFTPDDVVDRIRIVNWLPDATAGGTLGSAAAPMVAGNFVAAIGAWDEAYKLVNKKPMFMEQWIGGTTAWCVKYQFGAEDGGQVANTNHAQILQIR